jgi:hypothetical protein
VEKGAKAMIAGNLFVEAGRFQVSNGATVTDTGLVLLSASLDVAGGGPGAAPGTFTINSTGELNVESGSVATVEGTLSSVLGGVVVNGSLTDSTLTIGSGGLLKGVGTVVGDVHVNSMGTVQPGLIFGTLTVTGNLTLDSGANLNASLLSAKPGNYGQINVQGRLVNLGGAVFNLSPVTTPGYPPFSPSGGDQFIVIGRYAPGSVQGQLVAGIGIDAIPAGQPLTEGAVLSTHFLGTNRTATITYRAGQSQNAVAVTIVPLAPVILAHPNNPTNQTSANFTYSATDVGVTYLTSLDNGAFVQASGSSFYLGLADGLHTFQVEAVANGAVSAPAVFSWTVDTVAPKILDIKVLWGSSGVASLSSMSGRDLPWMGINRIEVVFSKDVIVTSADLALLGLTVGNYGIAGFNYDAASHTALWTLTSALGVDHLTLQLDGANAIHDSAGNLLLGGPTSQMFNVLPGDFNGDGIVDSSDMVLLRNNFSSTSPYNILYDINGDGSVDINDYTAFRKWLGSRL